MPLLLGLDHHIYNFQKISLEKMHFWQFLLKILLLRPLPRDDVRDAADVADAADVTDAADETDKEDAEDVVDADTF